MFVFPVSLARKGSNQSPPVVLPGAGLSVWDLARAVQPIVGPGQGSAPSSLCLDATTGVIHPSSAGTYKTAYDGTDHISLNEDLRSWSAANKVALTTSTSMKALMRASLEVTSKEWLHLKDRKEMLQCAGTRGSAPPPGSPCWPPTRSGKWNLCYNTTHPLVHTR